MRFNRNTVGSRSIETHLYKPGTYPFDLIAPITILWQPLSAQTSETTQGQGNGQQRDAKDVIRTVWLMFHPAVYDDVSAALQQAAPLALDSAKRQKTTENIEYEIEIADLRGHFNIFELVGPRSNQVLKGVLKPVLQDSREPFTQVGIYSYSEDMIRGLIINSFGRL